MTSSYSQEDLNALLTSGLACLRQGISLVEVIHHPDWDAASDETRPYELGRVLYANAALEEMTGLTQAELQANGLVAMLGPGTEPADVAALQAALHARGPSIVRCQCYQRSLRQNVPPRPWHSSISVTPVNQLPFMSAAWMPANPSPPPCVSPARVSSNNFLPGQDDEPVQGLEPADKDPPRHAHSGSSLPTTLGDTRQYSSSGSLTVESVATQLLGHRGPVIAQYLLTHEDVTARMNEEMTWRLRDHALSSCSEGITIADPSQPDAPLIYVNDAFLQITGYSREDVMGRNCRFLQGEETSREAVATLKAAVVARRKATVELLNYKKTGEAFWNRLSITPVFNDRGDLVSYIGVQSDVTELIRRKEEERKLMEAKVAAETATEAKSMFLANMSHEIRTPLNGMMATAQLLLASALTPEQRELAETILESGNSLLGILGDILDFSKLDHGSISLNYEPLSLRRSIEACIEIVAPDAMKKGLTIYYTAEEDALTQQLMGDAIRLRQILTNLLSNAVKFTDKGEVHVDVKVEDFPARQSCCCPRLPGGTVVQHACSIHQRPEANQDQSQQQRQQQPQGCPAAPVLCPPRPPHPKVRTQAKSLESCSAPNTPGTHGASMDEEEEAWGQAVHRRRSLEDACLVPMSSGSSSQGRDPAPNPPSTQRRVRISVRDTGIGIPADVVGGLFQCFKQGSESMARRYGGTGLGLAICKRLADLMQGCVWVESPGQDQGCTFHFCVPANFQPKHLRSSGLVCDDERQGLSEPMPPQPGSPSEHATTASSRVSTELDPATVAEDGDWSGIRPAPPSVGYASSSASTGTSTGGEVSHITVSQGQFTVLAADEHHVLEGRRVLIDTTHPGLALQISQSCRQLGMLPCLCTPTAESGGVTPLGQPQDILVVSTDKAASALRSGWKGRPVVSVGPRQLLTANLHPLVVMVPEPVLHQRLANALVKSTVLLKWGSGSKTSAPKLANQPISPAQLADFKTWREKGHGASVTAALWQQQAPNPLRGQYVGGQLAVLHSQQPPQPVDGGLGFSGGFARPFSFDTSMTRRSSLDNSSLDRALVQQMQASAQARASAPSGAATATATVTGVSTGSPVRGSPVANLPWRSHAASGVHVPQAIPENTEFQPEDSSPRVSKSSPTVDLPAAPPPAAAPAPAAAPPAATPAAPQVAPAMAQATAAPAAPAQQLRILIAEDNKVNQKVVLKVLQQISGGAVTDVVENGLQVLEALKKKSYDMILMDIHMPLMDGLEATRRIVATYPAESRPRIIALSADTLQALHDRCREAGIEEFIVKPFRIEDLRRVMQSYSRTQPCAPQAAPAAAGTAPAAVGQQPANRPVAAT